MRAAPEVTPTQYCYQRTLDPIMMQCGDFLLQSEGFDDRIIICVDTWRTCIELGRLREWAAQNWAAS